MNRRLVQLFKRAGDENIHKRIANMPEEYQKGYCKGFVDGRDRQRKADIAVAERLLGQQGKP